MMKKVLPAILCVSLCLVVAFMLPRIGTSKPMLDDSSCLICHDASYPSGDLHDRHSGFDCDICHVVTGDTPSSASCLACHPLDDPGNVCGLVTDHDNDPNLGTDCLECHTECEVETTTTTTTDGTTTTTTADVTTTTTTAETTTTATDPCPSEELYGEDSEEVEILIYLRDNVLNATPEGQEIIRLYYQWAPVIMIAIQNDEEVKAEIKAMVDGILFLITE